MKAKLTDKQLAFCREYVKNGYNGTQAVISAGYSSKGADVQAVQLLGNIKIKQRIDHHKQHLEELLHISKSKVLSEHRKLAFSSMAHLHNTWIERKEFDQLTDDQKECISEITTKVEKKNSKTGEAILDEWVKIKLYDKQKSLDAISKIMGYDAPVETSVHFRAEKGEIGALFPFAKSKE